MASASAELRAASRWIVACDAAGLLPLIVLLVGSPSGLVLIAFVLLANPYPRSSAGMLEVDATSLRHNGRDLADRSSFRAGFIVPSAAVPTEKHLSVVVRLERGFGRSSVLVGLETEAAADALLGALALDPTSTVTAMPVGSRLLTSRIGWLLLVIAPLAYFFSWFLFEVSTLATLLIQALVALSIVGYFVLRTIPGRLTVGADGLFVQWLGTKVFLPFADIKRIENAQTSFGPMGIAVTANNGKRYVIPMKPRLVLELRERDLRVAMKKVEAAREAFANRKSGAEVMLPERGEKSTIEWVRAFERRGPELRRTIELRRSIPSCCSWSFKIQERVATNVCGRRLPSARTGTRFESACESPRTRAPNRKCGPCSSSWPKRLKRKRSRPNSIAPFA